ncbi:accessory Sec system translocase SecA2 [Bacillus solimangrovi]|uniref:Protein translocase subunit SecA n=1 Tax=Bacillus solimangrovi TaxID=1305675 RepID=A0A1E5LDK9_9BACI|nr:accessory Sec system translocase SecA2 [Bacillus solimangrovi]OEH92167.1 accessory Sec system translocase SecA2 [Bacillus solimangrovi]
MLNTLKRLLGDEQQRKLKKHYKIVEQINSLEAEYEQLSDEDLKLKTTEFKEALSNGKTIDDIKVESFAIVREASKRILGMRHYDVQLIGGLVLTDGNIAEMPTGEGKTLVASLPSYLRALEGKGVHVITVNEYLARRDRDMIGQIHEFLGLTVGLNIPMMEPADKVAAYKADITYGVGNEFGFDYLRDNMVADPRQKVQRPYHFVITDEVDSVLIDEAKTPLIIAGKTEVSAELHFIGAQVAKRFKDGEDFTFDIETRATNLTDQGIEKVENAFGVDNLYEIEHQTLYHYMIQALRARVMFERDVDYIVQDGKVLLIDMFTGRPMEGRTLSDGLHQAIEAKEGLEITEENKTQASITIQNYYRMYPIISGMTGTAKTEESEFQQLYGMDVIQIPTNKPIIRDDRTDRVYLTKDQKYNAVMEEVKQCHAKGQPVLVGTTSILQSEQVAEYFDKAKLPYHLLNAKSIEQEVKLISLAGQKGQITIATNMAGRGTDIMLGEGVAELGGLHVIGTERHESRRIDNQLKGRSGRQGDTGSTQFIISLEDDMFRRFAKEEVERTAQKIKADENGQITDKKIHELVDRVQRICEGSNYAVREYNLKLDNVINEQRGVIYSLRDKVLENEDIVSIILPMIDSYATYTVNEHCPEELVPEEWPLKELEAKLNYIIVEPKVVFNHNILDISEVKEEVEEKTLAYKANIELLKENKKVQFTIKRLTLMVIDHYYTKHLESMTRLKEGIGLRHYQQEDPMRLYQKEGLELFSKTFSELERDASFQLARLARPILEQQQSEEENK